MIRRSERKRGFTTIDNRTIEDDRLSFKAKGVLIYVLSKPDNWTANESQLADVGPDGTTAIRSALNELKDVGYLVIQPIRDEAGKIRSWEQIIYDVPQEKTDRPARKKSTLRETRIVDNNPIINTVVTNTVETKTKSIEPDGSPPKPLSEWNRLVAGITYCVHGHKDFSILAKDGPTGQGVILREAKIVKRAKYTADDVWTWWKKVWEPRYKWTEKDGGEIKRPTPVELRAGIPAISAISPDELEDRSPEAMARREKERWESMTKEEQEEEREFRQKISGRFKSVPKLSDEEVAELMEEIGAATSD